MIDERPGLRERKRLRTREALLDAASTVFAERGYDAATVEEIADRADISARTFFRYFDGKDAVALAWLIEFYATLLDAVEARPADEPALDALTVSAGIAWRASDRPDGYAEIIALVDGSTALLAALLRRADEFERRIAAALASREGKSADDPDLRLLVATVNAAMRIATDVWLATGEPLVPALEDTFVRVLGALRARLAG